MASTIDAGDDFVKRLLDAFGLKGKEVTRLVIDIPYDDIMTLGVYYLSYAPVDGINRAIELLERYDINLKRKEEPEAVAVDGVETEVEEGGDNDKGT